MLCFKVSYVENRVLSEKNCVGYGSPQLYFHSALGMQRQVKYRDVLGSTWPTYWVSGHPEPHSEIPVSQKKNHTHKERKEINGVRHSITLIRILLFYLHILLEARVKMIWALDTLHNQFGFYSAVVVVIQNRICCTEQELKIIYF